MIKPVEPKKILCIHDLSGVGRCSLAVILPVLSVMGLQPVALPTVVLSTHTGGLGTPARLDGCAYGEAALEHYHALGLDFDCIYTGYLGGEAQVALAEKAFALWPSAHKVVDPVMGDNGKAYATVTPELISRIRQLCRSANLILPNYTEAQLLLQRTPVDDPLDDAAAQALADELTALAPSAVVTGLPLGQYIGCAGSGSTAAPTLTVESSYPLQYAKQFTVDECTGGYELITMADSQYLVVPQGAAVPEDLPQGTTVLQQPIENIYLVSTSAMDPIISLGALDSIALSGTKADGWYLPEAKAAMQAGQIAYAGKYSAPDYEKILAANCGLAIENTMIYHTPEVKEQLERFGIPVLVERSSYESGPLARMEWIKFYGILLGKEELAQQVFDRQAERIASLLDQQSTGKSCAFFSISANNLANVRKGGDYVARMIEMAGADYVFADLTDSGNSLSTMNLPLEDFYAGARDADFLIYNSTIYGEIQNLDDLFTKSPLLKDFKAVKEGKVYCTTADFFQETTGIASFIEDLHAVMTGDTSHELKYLKEVK